MDEFVLFAFCTLHSKQIKKYEQKIARISALYSEGSNLDNFLFVHILGETMRDDYINSFWNLLTCKAIFFSFLDILDPPEIVL